MTKVTIKRALISVSNKEGLIPLAKHLHQNLVEIVSTGGTGRALSQNNIPFTPIEEVTGNPESFSGRMKTLSFEISSSLLYRRDVQTDVEQAKKLNIEPIDLVVCNLYPFSDTAKNTDDLDELIEQIDIGGPTMLRSAAKNYKYVCVLTDPSQYEELLNQSTITTSLEQRKKLALASFAKTARYDSAISSKLSDLICEENNNLHVDLTNAKKLRYGENSHQWAKVIVNESTSHERTLAGITPLQGKALSYNNFLDSDAALRCNSELSWMFDKRACVTIIKHTNPCGASVSDEIDISLRQAWRSDPISSFGSIIAFNQEVNTECAYFLNDKFVEVLIAPSFSQGAREVFLKKKNLRLLEIPPIKISEEELMIRSINGGWVIQNEDTKKDIEFQLMTKSENLNGNSHEILQFSSIIAKHLKSNAIALSTVTDKSINLAGAGMGNPNRLVSTEQAIAKAKENNYDLKDCILCSDAFFPFRDNIDLAAKYGIKSIIQPGGSIKDNEVIKAADEHQMTMYFTGTRHFRH